MTYSPPPAMMSTCPVASAVCEVTTSPTSAALSLIANSFSRICGRLASVMSEGFMPSPIATMPMSGM